MGQSDTNKPSIPWFAYLWFCLPMLLVFLGGMLGGLLGGLASALNLALYRSGLPALARYLLGGIVTCGAFALYLVAAMLLSLWSNHGKGEEFSKLEKEPKSANVRTLVALQPGKGWVN